MSEPIRPSEAVWARIAMSLAMLKHPEFPEDSRKTVIHSVAMSFLGLDMIPADRDKLIKMVKAYSFGHVVLRQADPASFPTIVKGEIAYMELVSLEGVRKVLIGPYWPPVSYVD